MNANATYLRISFEPQVLLPQMPQMLSVAQRQTFQLVYRIAFIFEK